MIIALLTDFGTKDFFVSAMKGVILSINEDAKIIDLTHEIEPQNIQSAGFTLAFVYQYFPPKTIFVTVVDPEVGSNRRAILVETTKYFFVSPDNGLLSLVLSEEQSFRAFELTNPKFLLDPMSRTFHGRDVFAPVAAWLSKGLKSSEFGAEITDLVRLEAAKLKLISANCLEAQIIQIDHFGNLVTNLKRDDLPPTFSLRINHTIIEKQFDFYSQAIENEIFMIFGSVDYLEIVAYKNSASKLLKVKVGEKFEVDF